MISPEKLFWRNWAAKAVNSAKCRGNLPDPQNFKCHDCGKPAREYDHRDYLDALNVVPVCHRCNCKRGSAWYPAWIDRNRDRFETYQAVCGWTLPNGKYAEATPFKQRYLMHFPEIAVKARQAQLTTKRI